MSTAFSICIVGLILGLIYTSYEALLRHKTLEQILSSSIPYYKFLGATGVLGFLLFFAFLLASVSAPTRRK